MVSRIFLVCVLGASSAWAQSSTQVEVANLREDVRGLIQRVGELQLRVEQLERENSELTRRVESGQRSAVTLAQLNEAISTLNQTIRSSAASTKAETLEVVAGQIEKLAKQTNAAIDSLARSGSASPASFSDDYPKEGISYTVQRGDTVAGIAKKLGAKSQDIINANKIADPSRIQVGQTLFIPGGK